MAEATNMRIGPVELAVQIEGEGPNIVFVHGYTTSSRFWRSQIEEFSTSYRVVAFDLRGHGASSKSTDVPYTIETFARDLVGLLHELAIEKAILVGLSMGGPVVMKATVEHPELVRALVLADTASYGFGGAVNASTVVAQIEEIGVEAASLELLEHSFDPATDEATVEWARKEVRKVPFHVARDAVLSLGDFDARDRLAEITQPTLVVAGAKDKITPVSQSEDLHRQIAGSRLALIPGSNHFPMVEQPTVFNAVLREFLESLGDGTAP
jgi:3-oxoadipate enol-lactonase